MNAMIPDENIIEDIFNKAAQVFGSPEAARQWMRTPHKDFGGMEPLQYCKPYNGARQVQAWLAEKLPPAPQASGLKIS